LGLLALVELIAVGVAFLSRGKAKRASGNGDAAVSCGPADNFQPGTVTAFVRGRFYLARLNDGGFMAISRQCTHLGCTLPWVEEEKRFACPCHASAFDITGQVISAPASRALDIYALTIENNIVAVDTREPIRRSGFNKEQVVYPKS
jgi:cytochrome b6-f complex iron-sulfur subunit